jgi:D-serine deaminase-like pyridoxal phosphate-dependent protein
MLPDQVRLTSGPDRPQGFGVLQEATAGLEPPYAVVDLGALRANAADLVRRAGGKPIRLASKSVRCRELTSAVLALDGFSGILAFTLREALWLAREHTDVVVAYPTTDAAALAELAADAELAARVTIMIDSAEQLFVSGEHELRVCLDLDASYRLLGGRVHIGARRSPIHTPEQAAELARAVLDRPGFRLVGLMSYEGQIAGVGDDAPGSPIRRAAIRAMQRASVAELRDRRAAMVAAVRSLAPLEFVNGGGTGSLTSTSAESAITEVAAGSGLYAPALFDTYRGFRPAPAAFFVLPVVRRPAPGIATVLGGGWIASGPVGRDRLPTPVWPEGLRMIPAEGGGEVQTPLTGAGRLAIGDRVWFRHTKAGELCEHVNTLHLVDGGRVVAEVPTYRGDGKAFA